MKRRTNLFYNDNSVDSIFLTFSNFTEHLTGVFLATNFKMFPSRFLCVNIPELQNEKYSKDIVNYVKQGKDENTAKELARTPKQAFIEDYLVGYYENKLAYIRDIINENNEDNVHPDDIISYLGYLIDTIKKFDDSAKIVFNSEITEQDYNGTFTDIICTIDSSVGFNKEYNIIQNNDSEHSSFLIDNEIHKKYLYGWAYTEESSNELINVVDNNENGFDLPENTELNCSFKIVVDNKTYNDVTFDKKSDDTYVFENDIFKITIDENKVYIDKENLKKFELYSITKSYQYDGPSAYESVKPILDGDPDNDDNNQYYTDAIFQITDNDAEFNNIEFNVVIPLYSIVNMDFNTNNTILKELANKDIIDGLPDINMSITDSESHADNVPYGIWFANKQITLTRDTGTEYAPSWSLLIGTQFKPFPTSKYLRQDCDVVSKMAGFATYAQILAKQSEVYDKMLEYAISFNDSRNEIDAKISKMEELKEDISSMYATLNNIANIEKLKTLKEELEKLKDELNSVDSSASNKHIWKFL